MPGLLSAPLLAAYQQEAKSVFPLVELYLPSGTKRLGLQDVNVIGTGSYRGDIQSIGRVRRALSRLSNSLELSSTQLTFADPDFSFTRELGGASGHLVKGSRALIRACSTAVASASWSNRFDGIIDTWDKAGPCLWTLTLQPRDAPYRGLFPKTQILPSDFPYVFDKTIYAQYVPTLWGIHDSRGSTDAGMVPCPYVDTINWRHLVAQGWVTPDRVYKAKALQAGSSYSVERLTINGRLYTFIKWTSDPGTADVTADVTGYESVGDGSGTLLTGADALLHLLVNFVFGDYQGGLWASVGSLPLNTTSFTAAQAWLVARVWQRVSRRYGGVGQTSAALAVQEFCQSTQLYPFFSPDSKLSLAWEDHTAQTLSYGGDRFFRWDLDDLGMTYQPKWERNALADRVNLHYALDSVRGAYAQQLEVRDFSVDEQAPGELKMPWSHAALV